MFFKEDFNYAFLGNYKGLHIGLTHTAPGCDTIRQYRMHNCVVELPQIFNREETPYLYTNSCQPPYPVTQYCNVGLPA